MTNQNYKKLIEIRKQKNILITGSYQLLLEENAHVFAYLRFDEQETILVLCNFSEEVQALTSDRLPEEMKQASVFITNREKESNDRSSLEPYEATVYQWKNSKN